MSRRNMSERMCIGLMLCEAAPCDLRFNDRCVLPQKVVPRNKSINDFRNLVGTQSPQLFELLERIGVHGDKYKLPELNEDEKALLIELMNKISAKGEKQERIFDAMKRAFGITDRQIKEMLKLKKTEPSGDIFVASA